MLTHALYLLYFGAKISREVYNEGPIKVHSMYNHSSCIWKLNGASDYIRVGESTQL